MTLAEKWAAEVKRLRRAIRARGHRGRLSSFERWRLGELAYELTSTTAPNAARIARHTEALGLTAADLLREGA